MGSAPTLSPFFCSSPGHPPPPRDGTLVAEEMKGVLSLKPGHSPARASISSPSTFQTFPFLFLNLPSLFSQPTQRNGGTEGLNDLLPRQMGLHPQAQYRFSEKSDPKQRPHKETRARLCSGSGEMVRDSTREANKNHPARGSGLNTLQVPRPRT